MGVANAADSFAAVRKFVFEEKSVEPARLRRALANDFAGEEALRQKLLNDAPKYGNDDVSVDLLARFAVDVCLDELDKYRNFRGGYFTAGLTAITANISFGALTAATPDGRFARTSRSPRALRPERGATATAPRQACSPWRAWIMCA